MAVRPLVTLQWPATNMNCEALKYHQPTSAQPACCQLPAVAVLLPELIDSTMNGVEVLVVRH